MICENPRWGLPVSPHDDPPRMGRPTAGRFTVSRGPTGNIVRQGMSGNRE